MAQVTMDSREYIELLDKVRAWDDMCNKMVAETEIRVGEDYHSGYRIEMAFVMPEKTKMAVARKVAAAVASSEQAMKYLVEDGYTMLDLVSGYIGRDWGENKEHEVSLLKFPEFKARYEELKAEQEAE